MFSNPHRGNIRQLTLSIAQQQMVDFLAPFAAELQLYTKPHVLNQERRLHNTRVKGCSE